MSALESWILKKYRLLRANNLDDIEADDRVVVKFIMDLVCRRDTEIQNLKEENEALLKVARSSSELVEQYESFIEKQVLVHKDIDTSPLLQAIDGIQDKHKETDSGWSS